LNPGDWFNPDRDVTPAFLRRVNEWIARQGEVLVVLRYLRAAGGRDFALCQGVDDFRAVVAAVPIGTDIEVFRDRQLPLRAAVTEPFISETLAAIGDTQEYLAITLRRRDDSPISAGFDQDVSQAALASWLRQHLGAEVAVGMCPNFLVADHEGLISASKGGVDGPR
jgi:hypothetical protein